MPYLGLTPIPLDFASTILVSSDILLFGALHCTRVLATLATAHLLILLRFSLKMLWTQTMMARLACVKPQILADQRQSELMTDELHVSSFSHGYDSHTHACTLCSDVHTCIETTKYAMWSIQCHTVSLELGLVSIPPTHKNGDDLGKVLQHWVYHLKYP